MPHRALAPRHDFTKCHICDDKGYTTSVCAICNGSGEGDHDGSICSFCKGTGERITRCTICEGEYDE